MDETARFSRRDLEEAAAAAYRYPLTVKFQECDPAGLVFFARVLEWCHDAYFAWLSSEGLDLPAAMAKAPWVAPMVHAEADYLAPIRFGDALVVEVVAARVAGSRFTVGHRVVRAESGEVAALGQHVHVVVSRPGMARVPLPGELADALSELEGRP